MAEPFPHQPIIDDILLGRPGVKGGTSWGYPSYRFGRRIFCFGGQWGVALKLPAARVAELVAEHPEMQVFEVVQGLFWQGWVSINPADPEAYYQWIGLFDEAIAYVSAL